MSCSQHIAEIAAVDGFAPSTHGLAPAALLLSYTTPILYSLPEESCLNYFGSRHPFLSHLTQVHYYTSCGIKPTPYYRHQDAACPHPTDLSARRGVLAIRSSTHFLLSQVFPCVSVCQRTILTISYFRAHLYTHFSVIKACIRPSLIIPWMAFRPQARRVDTEPSGPVTVA